MRVRSYNEAVRFALSAGEDAANRRMRKAGRKVWTAVDFDHAAGVAERFLVDLGFDIPGWSAMAGVPRNEPPEPKKIRAPKRRSVALGLARAQQASKPEPVQLNFGFA